MVVAGPKLVGVAGGAPRPDGVGCPPPPLLNLEAPFAILDHDPRGHTSPLHSIPPIKKKPRSIFKLTNLPFKI